MQNGRGMRVNIMPARHALISKLLPRSRGRLGDAARWADRRSVNFLTMHVSMLMGLYTHGAARSGLPVMWSPELSDTQSVRASQEVI